MIEVEQLRNQKVGPKDILARLPIEAFHGIKLRSPAGSLENGRQSFLNITDYIIENLNENKVELHKIHLSC